MKLLLIFVILFASVATFGQAETKAVRAFIDGFNKHDAEAMTKLVADDVKWYSVGGASMSLQMDGKASVRAFMDEKFKMCPTCRSKITSISQVGTRVSVTESASWISTDGPQKSESFTIYEFEKGLVARAYYHGDPAKPTTYDEALAKRLGADERGMKTYVFVNLISGKKKFEKAERDKLIAGHMENIGRLAASGKLVIAGPFFDDNAIRGIYIFDVDTIEKAKALTETDPAVQAGVFEFEMRLWYGTAALKELNRIHNSIQKQSITGK